MFISSSLGSSGKVTEVFPELFQCHGTADELVLHSWGEETNSMLKSLGSEHSFIASQVFTMS